MESINIYNVNGQSLMSVGIGQDCVYHNELQGDEYVTLRWESDEYQALPVGAYVNYNGRNFRLVEPCEPTRKTEFVYTYEPTFYATHCAWKKVQACYYEYLNSGITITNNTTTHKVSINVTTSVSAREMDWSFTGNLPDALAMVLQSIYNETGLLVEFAYAEEIGNKLIELTAQGLSVYDMIEQLSEQCGKEWWVDYSQTTPVIHLATLEKTATPSAQNVDENGIVLLNVGTDITNPSVQTNKDDYFTRFYFFGSNRNIQQSESITNSAVVNKRLTLNPKHQTETGYTTLNHYPQGFIDINANITPDTDTNYQPTLASSEIYAKTVFLDDIYPRANYKVKEVKFANIDVEDDTGKKTGEQLPIYFVTLYDANDAQHTAIGFNDWVGENASHVMGDMVAGLVPSIAFRGGYLQGLEFELIIHKAGTTTRGITFASDYFEIAFDQNSNPRLPNATIKPIANDDCTLFNVRMPNKYILNAYHELEAKALEYIEDAKTDKATYDITCNPIKFESVPALASLNIGYKSAIIYPNSARTDSRVIMIEKHLDIESDIKLQLGYRKTAGSIKTLQEVVTSTQDNVEKVVKTADYNRNKMIAMRTNLNAQREALENVFDPDGYFDSDKIRPMSIETQMLAVGAKSQQFAITGSSFKLPDYSSGHGIFTWTAGTLNHFTIDESGVKNWTISAGTQNLANGNLYYVYAKCGKANTSATIVAEQTQRKFDADATYYYFLIGTISSESQDADNHLWGRVLTFTYGSAQINGREITAGVIKGGAGAHSVKIDLEEGVIEGNIKLTAGDTDNKAIIDSIIGDNTTVSGAVSTAQTANANASSALTTANSANTKIDNLEVGGRNLVILNDCTLGNCELRNNGFVNTNTDTKNYLQCQVQLFGGDTVLATYGETYTAGATGHKEILFTTGSISNLTRWRIKHNGNTRDISLYVEHPNLESNTKYILSFDLIASNPSNIGGLVINNIKLEKGNKSTDWTPAPEDTDSKIDNIEVGGRNLISLTDTEWSNNAGTASWKRYNMPNVPLANGDYMLSFDVKTSNGTDVFYAGIGETDSTRIAVERIRPTTSYTRMSVKIVNSGSYSINSVIVSNAKAYGRGNDNNTGTLYIKNVKLEKGNKATDWTPAPEDVQEGIDLSNLQGTCDSRTTASYTDTYNITCDKWKSSYQIDGTRINVRFGDSTTDTGSNFPKKIKIGSSSALDLYNEQGSPVTKLLIRGGSEYMIALKTISGTLRAVIDSESILAEHIASVIGEAMDNPTDILGGLILTSMIQLRDKGKVTGGMNGLLSSLVAFWAGGTMVDASKDFYDSTCAKVVINRDGSAKFGNMEITNDGSVRVPDTNNYSRFQILNSGVPTSGYSDYILSAGTAGNPQFEYVSLPSTMTFTIGDTATLLNLSSSSRPVAYALSKSVGVSFLGRKFDVKGSVNIRCSNVDQNVSVWLETDGGQKVCETEYTPEGTYERTLTFNIDEGKFDNDVTTLYLYAKKNKTGKSDTVTISVSSSNNIGWKFYHDNTRSRTIVGNNGLAVIGNQTNFIQLIADASNNLTMKLRGNINMNGLVWAGMIESGGMKTPIFSCSGISVSSSASGSLYTITITGLSSAPAVTATPYVSGVSGRGWSAMVSSISHSGTTSTIKIRTTSDNTDTQCAFYLSVYGNPA